MFGQVVWFGDKKERHDSKHQNRAKTHPIKLYKDDSEGKQKTLLIKIVCLHSGCILPVE